MPLVILSSHRAPVLSVMGHVKSPHSHYTGNLRVSNVPIVSEMECPICLGLVQSPIVIMYLESNSGKKKKKKELFTLPVFFIFTYNVTT